MASTDLCDLNDHILYIIRLYFAKLSLLSFFVVRNYGLGEISLRYVVHFQVFAAVPPLLRPRKQAYVTANVRLNLNRTYQQYCIEFWH